MAKTRARRRSPARSYSPRTSTIVVAAPRRAPARRSAPARVKRRRSYSGGGHSSGIGNVLRKSAFGYGLGLAQHAGYLARVPTIMQLGAEGSLALICLGLRKFAHGPAWLLDVAEVSAVVAANHFGREGLAGNTRGVSGIGADPYAVEGDEESY